LLLLRTIAILDAALIAVCAAAFVLSGDRKYLRWALRLLQVGVAAGLLFFAVLILERIG
jgi:hypothetical protein